MNRLDGVVGHMGMGGGATGGFIFGALCSADEGREFGWAEHVVGVMTATATGCLIGGVAAAQPLAVVVPVCAMAAKQRHERLNAPVEYRGCGLA